MFQLNQPIIPKIEDCFHGTGNVIDTSTQQQQKSTINNSNNSNSNNNNTIDHGEMDEASSGVTSVSGWRCPAPYRCGHCHQVSNWKHVIQVFTNKTKKKKNKTKNSYISG